MTYIQQSKIKSAISLSDDSLFLCWILYLCIILGGFHVKQFSPLSLKISLACNKLAQVLISSPFRVLVFIKFNSGR
jgi:hypothetical protein